MSVPIAELAACRRIRRQNFHFRFLPLPTDGDAFVFLPGANLIHTGDLLFLGRYPVVDFTVGGSLAGMAASLQRIEQVGDAQTRVIPGHGPVATKAELRAARETWLSINQRLETMAKEGRTIEEVLKAPATKDFDARVGPRRRRARKGSCVRRTAECSRRGTAGPSHA